MEPSIYAIAEKTIGPMTEIHHLATIRMQIKGSRKVITAKTSEIFAYLAAKKSEPVSLSHVHSFLTNLNGETLKDFVESRSASVYFFDIPNLSFFYLPAGFAYLEIVGQADVVGVRMQMIARTPMFKIVIRRTCQFVKIRFTYNFPL